MHFWFFLNHAVYQQWRCFKDEKGDVGRLAPLEYWCVMSGLWGSERHMLTHMNDPIKQNPDGGVPSVIINHKRNCAGRFLSSTGPGRHAQSRRCPSGSTSVTRHAVLVFNRFNTTRLGRRTGIGSVLFLKWNEETKRSRQGKKKGLFYWVLSFQSMFSPVK